MALQMGTPRDLEGEGHRKKEAYSQWGVSWRIMWRDKAMFGTVSVG